jgi:uncharacterized protein YigE (DUF2233 family)
MWLASMLAFSVVTAPVNPVKHQRMNVLKNPCDVITADMKQANIYANVILAKGFPGTDENFESMIKKPQLITAINGAYFDVNTLKPIGDIWTDGELQSFGGMGTVFCLGDKGEMDIRRVERHRRQNWSSWSVVLGCGPALMLDGKINCDPESEGFRNPKILGKAARMGLGITKDRRLMFVLCRGAVTLPEFAAVFQKLGVHEAMNLDAGGSLGMWYRGKTIQKPSRKLTNLLAVYRQ